MKKVLMAVSVALVLASCSSDPKAAPATTTSAKAAAASAAPSTVSASDTSAAPASSSSTASTSSESSSSDVGSESTTTVKFSGDKNSAFCKTAVDLNGLNDFGAAGGTDPATMKSDMAKAFKALAAIEPQVPAEIKADFAIAKDLFLKLDVVLKKLDYDLTKAGSDPAAIAEIQKLSAAASDPAFSQASVRFDSYLLQVCGIDPNQ